jgi:pimeloyl-ACP methyl ester carboxylesterase
LNKYPISDEEVAHYVKAYSQPGALHGDFNYYRAAADEDPPQWQADANRQLSTPFLFLFGTRRVRTAEAMGTAPLEDVWRPIFPNGRAKHLGHYGHFLQWEAPEEVNRELLAFLGESAG